MHNTFIRSSQSYEIGNVLYKLMHTYTFAITLYQDVQGNEEFSPVVLYKAWSCVREIMRETFLIKEVERSCMRRYILCQHYERGLFDA